MESYCSVYCTLHCVVVSFFSLDRDTSVYLDVYESVWTRLFVTVLCYFGGKTRETKVDANGCKRMRSEPLRGILRFEDWFRDSAVSVGYFRHFHVNRKIIKKEKKTVSVYFNF